MKTVCRRTNAGIAVIAAFLIAVPAGAARGKSPWTMEDLLRIRTLSGPQASPDGRRAVVTVSIADDDTNAFNTDLYLVALPREGEPPGEAIRLTRSPKGDHDPRWSPKGDRIAFISERPPEKASDEEGSQAWIILPDGGEAWQAARVEGSVGALAWSPDGATLALLVTEPASADRKKRDKEKNDWTVVDSEFQRDQIWLADAASGASVQVTRGGIHFTSLDWSPDGSKLVVAGQPTPRVPDYFNANIYRLDLGKALARLKEEAARAAGGSPKPDDAAKGEAGGAPPALAEPAPILPAPCACGTARYSPDGDTIAFLTQDDNREWFTNTYVATIRENGSGFRLLSRSFDEDAGAIAWTPNGDAILFEATTRLAGRVYRLPAGGGKAEALAGGDEIFSDASLSRNGRVLYGVHQSPLDPPEVYALEISPEGVASAPRPASAFNAWTAGMATRPKEPFRWKGAGGMEIEGLLVRPDGIPPGTRVPLLTIVHGGPSGSFVNDFTPRRGAYPIQIFAAKGFAVLMPNPRGSGGYGEEFRSSNRRDWGGKDYEDIMAGIDALVASGVADPNRLGIMGWSYGGFMTSRAITLTKRFAAASVGAGVTDTLSFVGTADIPPFERSYFGAWPWEDPAVYTSHTAVYNARGVTTPTLIQHGEADHRVPISQGWELYVALEEQSVPVEFVTYPRQGHGFREPKLIRDSMRRNLEWFSRWILGEKAP